MGFVRDVVFAIRGDYKGHAAFGAVRRDLKEAGRDAGRMNAVLAGVGRGLGPGVGAAAGVLSFTGAIAKAREAVSKFDAISDDAAAAGLSTDFFQAMGAGAVQAGADLGTMNGALQTLARNSGLAAEGKGRMVTQLKALNPELLKSIQAASTQEQRVRLVADALARETDASRRAAIGAATLGGNWSELAEIFVRGSAGLDQIIASARDMGLIVPEGLLQRAGDLEAKLNTLSLVIDTQLNEALVELGPLLTFVADGVARFAKDMQNVGDSGIGQFLIDFVSGLNDGKPAAEALSSAWAEFSGNVERNAEAATAKVHAIEAEIIRLESVIAQAKATYGEGFITDEATRRNIAQLELLRGEIAKVQAASDALNAKLEFRSGHQPGKPSASAPGVDGGGGGGGGDDDDDRPARKTEAEREAERRGEQIAALEEERRLLGAANVERRISSELRRANTDAASQEGQRIAALVTQIEAESAAQEQLIDRMDQVRDIAGDALGGFVDDVREGASAAEALSNVLDQISAKLIDMALNSALDGLLGASGTSGGGGVGNLFASLFGGSRDRGGPIDAGRIYKVHKDELIVPRTPGTVVPVSALSSGRPQVVVQEIQPPAGYRMRESKQPNGNSRILFERLGEELAGNKGARIALGMRSPARSRSAG